MSKVLRLYLDNSVFGGCFDEVEGWAEASNRLIDSFVPGVRVALVSDATLDELAPAPARVRGVLARIRSIEPLTVDEEIASLARRFIEAGAVPPSKVADATHVAAATCRRADALVSWNFKHLVNLEQKRRFGGVALAQGYTPVEICTPQEVI